MFLAFAAFELLVFLATTLGKSNPIELSQSLFKDATYSISEEHWCTILGGYSYLLEFGWF